jgi:phosphoribosylanthranilate isomerase
LVCHEDIGILTASTENPRASLVVVGSAVRVKICGLTQAGDALACLAAGADWIGLNFHPDSPRFVSLAQAREIMAALPEPSRVVGVFVDRPSEEVSSVASQLGVSIVQLHGCGPPEDLLVLGSLQIIRAFRLGDVADISRMYQFLSRAREMGRAPDAVMVDSYVPGQAGGTGVQIAVEVLDLIPSLPHLILAGGLTPDNVAQRAARVRPWMVDVASGVETAPGLKDPTKVAAFIRAARSILGDENPSVSSPDLLEDTLAFVSKPHAAKSDRSLIS